MWTGSRSRGGVSITDMSRAPARLRLSVRGIGVAVSASTSTGARQLPQALLLRHAEAVLLVDDDEPEVAEAARPWTSSRCVPIRMSTLPSAVRATTSFCSSGGAEARQHLDHDREVGEPLLEGEPVLLREDRGRHQDRDLPAILHRLERRADRDLGLAVADVAADQAVHRTRGLHVLLDGLDRGQLIGRLLVREARLELALPHGVGLERVTG